MGLSTNELIAIVAGSLAGLIVFLAVLATIIYCCVVRRRRDRHGKKKPFSHSHLSPGTDSSLGKHSGHSHERHVLPDPRIDPRADPRLPKVGSSSLWFGSPSLYSSGPSPAYKGGRKGSQTRAVPEQQPLNTAPGGHMVYQGAGNMRIYHSQQSPAQYDSAYGMQGGMARAGSYMDIYAYPYGYGPAQEVAPSHAIMSDYPDVDVYFHDRYREREVRRTGRGLRRSQSDVTLHSTRRPKNRKQRKEAPFDRDERSNERSNERRRSKERRHSKDRQHSRDAGRTRLESGEKVQNERITTADVHKSKPAPRQPTRPKQEEIQSQTIDIIDQELPSSATDSAKLRAIERSREKEYAKQSGFNDVIRDGRDNHAFIANENDASDLHVQKYNYSGQPTKYENSIVAKMAAMVDTPKALRPSKTDASNMYGHSSQLDIESSRESFHAEVSKRLDIARDAEVSERLDIARDSGHVVADQPDGPAAISTGRPARASRPSSGKERQRSRRGSNVTDQDGNFITTEAFEFLDTYSDGETELGSGRVSPTQMKDYDITL